MKIRAGFIIIVIAFIVSNRAIADILPSKSYTLSGFILDAGSGESLAGAVIFPGEMPSQGTASNSYGYFSLTLPEGKYNMTVRYLGYKTKTIPVNLDENRKLNIELEQNPIALGEITVTGEKNNNNIVSGEIVSKVSVKEIQNIPVILGEKDILKTIQLLPGVTPAGEGNSGFYVRGGGIDQNLILLDEAPVYNPSHLLGFFSTFNSDAIKDVTLYKGGFPAEYGGVGCRY